MKVILEHGVLEMPAMKPMSPDDFYDFCQLNPDLPLELDKHGNILVMPPTGFEGSSFETDASTELKIWNRQTGLGYVTGATGGYTLANKAVRIPDAAWVEKSRIDALTRERRIKFPPLCPDFVIEIRSHSDNLKPLQEKMVEWIENDCRLAFLIDPIDKQAFIYRPGKEAQHIAGLTGSLSGEDVLPGFLLDLNLFA